MTALYAIARPSVCRSITLVDHTKTVDVRIMKLSAYGSPAPLVLLGKFHPQILKGFPSGGVKQEWDGKISHFLALRVNISKTVADTPKVTVND